MNVEIEVTYGGPNGTYSVEHDGEWYEFVAGRTLTVPERLAERLLDISDHTFEVGEEVEAEPAGAVEPGPVYGFSAGSGDGSGSGSGDGEES